MISNTFSNNNAKEAGGVLFFSNLLPQINFVNNVFFSNSAFCGDNYTSEANRIIIKNYNKNKIFFINAYSGLKLNNFEIQLIDRFGNYFKLDQGMYIKNSYFYFYKII